MILEFPSRDPQGQALGERLRGAREARGASLERLSAAMRISPDKLRRAEAGRERLSGSELYGAILELHLPMDLLFKARSPPSSVT
ncbi:RodZ family helix-turn-helix domain-containing protein [Caulobacter sp. S45]|uniref:helix-turn-helix domain-containing protein n=1 Tax=Caulobacter sp. S45 TaxID=1641861 RepID=UPI001575F31B|nr:helix-turn-helix domain-containing protein [Caulobacter sp. S45]